jgi:hypothetical protein
MNVKHIKIDLVTALVGAVGYFGFAWLAMYMGHFHEDAYILFKFVENIVAGNGISFSAHLGPAEGATDFLWLIMLAALHYLGLSVGMASAVLNTLGVFVTLFFINRLSGTVSIPAKLLLSALSLTLLLSSLSYAAAGGFSVWVYSAIIVLMLYYYFANQARYWHWIPLLALALGLFRPDGLIIGAGFTFITAWAVFSKGVNTRPFIATSVLAFVGGLAYFFWRMSYFETFLPLPLMVKSETLSLFEGWAQNWAWMSSNTVLLTTTLFCLLVLPFLTRNRSAKTALFLVIIAAIPFLLHLSALGFAHQSQNVGFRFQTPQMVFFYATLIFLLGHHFRHQRFIAALALAIMALLAYWSVVGVANTRQNFRYLASRNYINVFPFWFNQLLPSDSLVAVTEAGRLPYWASKYSFIDLVGLNTKEVATQGLQLEYLIKQNPSALFIWYDTGDKEPMVADLSVAELAKLNQANRVASKGKPETAVTRASFVAAEYLVQSGDYEMISVHYWNSHNHLFAFKKGLVDMQLVKTKIEQFSQDGYHYPYLQMQHAADQGWNFEQLHAQD